jgi:hypothetical protein
MLGRRAAVGLCAAFVTAFGGGVALAATHGSSHSSSKPHATTTQQRQAPSQSTPRMHHNCPHMGSSSMSPASASL